jgi:hypothetical protein
MGCSARINLSLIDLHCVGLLFAKGVLALHCGSVMAWIPSACLFSITGGQEERVLLRP